MISISQLEYLVAIAKLASFSAAAKACHVTQPTLSMQVQKAEEDLGLIIFDRSAKPLVPTDQGRLIISQAKEVLFEHQKLLELARSQHMSISGSLIIGVIPTLAPYLMPLFISEFALRYPNLHVTINEFTTDVIIEKVKERECDVGLLATPLGESGIFEDPLYYEPFYVYASDNHPLLDLNSVKQEDLPSKDIWLLHEGHCFRQQIMNVCKLRKLNDVIENVSFEGGNFETLRVLIKRTSGYTLLPQLYIDQLSQEERRKHVRQFINPPPTREISLVYQNNHWKTHIFNALATCIRESLPPHLKHDSSDHNVVDIH